MNNLAKKLSITAGLVTAFALAYQGLAPIWNLPLAEEIMKTASVIVLLMSGILSAFTGQKIILSRAQKDNIEDFNVAITENKKLAADGFFKGVVDVPDIEEATPKDLAFKHAEFEEEGGQGAVYSVPIASYDVFRSAVIGRGYDIDGAYSFQCWDGAALLWQQLGRNLSTGGTGAAKGCWENARTQNASHLFDLITDRSSLKRGDVAVFGGGQYGHIAFVDSVNGDGTVNLLGQNQNGSGNGSPFNVIRMSLNNFLGAFRLKDWNKSVPVVPTPAPAPVVKPQPAQGDTTPKIGDYVTTTATHDQNGAMLNLAIINDGNSVFSEVNTKGNAVLRKGLVSGGVRCGVPIGSLRKF